MRCQAAPTRLAVGSPADSGSHVQLRMDPKCDPSVMIHHQYAPHLDNLGFAPRDDDPRRQTYRMVALAGDGQVTLGDIVLKHGARKIRTLYDGQVLAGFAGAVADALTLFGKFEAQLKAWDGNLRRASVELAKEWRTDRYLRRLEAQLIVADPESLLVLSGEGDVIEPDDGIVAIGSGAPYATAAAKALVAHTEHVCPRDRRGGNDDRGRPLHLHQRPLHHRSRARIWQAGRKDRRAGHCTVRDPAGCPKPGRG